MIEMSALKDLIFVTFCINLIAVIEFFLLLYVNLRMNSYFEEQFDKIEKVLDGCVMYKNK